MKKILLCIVAAVLLIWFLSGCAAVEELPQPKDILFVFDSSAFESEEQCQEFIDNIWSDEHLNVEYKMLVYKMMTGEEVQIFTVDIEK